MEGNPRREMVSKRGREVEKECKEGESRWSVGATGRKPRETHPSDQAAGGGGGGDHDQLTHSPSAVQRKGGEARAGGAGLGGDGRGWRLLAKEMMVVVVMVAAAAAATAALTGGWPAHGWTRRGGCPGPNVTGWAPAAGSLLPRLQHPEGRNTGGGGEGRKEGLSD